MCILNKLYCYISNRGRLSDSMFRFILPDTAVKGVCRQAHTISDELCRKHGLSIIENPHLSKGKSHWEWELDQQNLSWKEQLKRTIDEVIKVSEDFEDFLQKCADFGILVDY